MSTTDNWKLLVFRDGRRVCNGPELLRELFGQLQHVLTFSDFDSQPARDELIEALLRSGELECALADHGDKLPDIARVTDELARALIGKRQPNFSPGVLNSLSRASVPQRLTLSSPEGFCYYALHPLDFADLLDSASIDAPSAAVIGIRSIGSTLSAVVSSWFELKGVLAERITVRPTGRPFDRELSLDQSQREWIRAKGKQAAHFFIVDEGPGLSGSSFLTVAEAVAKAGIDSGRIFLLPSAQPDLSRLMAPRAAERWNRFRTLSLGPTRYIPSEAAQFISAGAWRKRVFASESEWPAVWSWTERQKYTSAGGERIFRFDGHGHYGKAVRKRSELLAAHGWGPEASREGDGFSVSKWVLGNPARGVDLHTIMELARYCAFRAETFACEPSSQAPPEEMATLNLERAMGISQSIALPVERPTIADARMMPYEWIRLTSRKILKVDAAGHGDDHFYPGPTDIAWDLAGAITEWNLDREASELLVSEYKRISGDDIKKRLFAYLLAYCAFRLGFTLSAALSVDKSEGARFQQDAGIYRKRLANMLQLSTA